ncbi:hypothetical protein Leryth_009106, partial [Lithospermum erythrorhizon]
FPGLETSCGRRGELPRTSHLPSNKGKNTYEGRKGTFMVHPQCTDRTKMSMVHPQWTDGTKTSVTINI